MTKTATAWYPQSGLGYYVAQVGIDLQDNAGNLFVDNNGNNIIPNPYYVLGKYATAWSQVG